jgi:riboflavin-specific deaminase-like protein
MLDSFQQRLTCTDSPMTPDVSFLDRPSAAVHSDPSELWMCIDAANRATAALLSGASPQRFAMSSGELLPVADTDPRAALEWLPGAGWQSLLPDTDPMDALLDLYLPICSAHSKSPCVVGHLGQSLDGYIATTAGDSYYVTGPENILHLHRMRALSDAVIVGAGTIEADDPRLTTRHIAGANPLRVVIDPSCRLSSSHRVFKDQEAPTLRAIAENSLHGTDDSQTLRVRSSRGVLDLQDLLAQLYARGCLRIFVEGGGRTVSAFLEAGLLDRLQIAVATVFIGEGRRAIHTAPQPRLQDCLRPRKRVYRMGEDILFDCELRVSGTPTDASTAHVAAVQRIL